MPAASLLSVRTPRSPLRRCIVCRRQAEKAQLGRIVRTPQGDIRLGRAEGRGAYVCRGNDCAAALLTDSRPLARALRANAGGELLLEIARAYGPDQETT